MEIRVEKIEESDIPKKPRSLDLQSIYVKKPRISERKSLAKKEVSVWEVENKAPQKKLGSPLEEDGVVLPKSREKNRKEVSLSSLVPTSKRQPNSSNAPKSNKDHISSVNRSNGTSSRSVTTDNLQGTNADAQHLANDLHSQLSGKTDGAYVTDVSKNKVFMGDSFLAPKQRSGISNSRKSKDPLSLETEISNPCHAKTNTDVQDNESIDKDDLNQKALNDKKRKKKKKVEECDMSGSHKDDSAPSTSAEHTSFIKDENRKAGNRKDCVKMSEQINLGNQARSADKSANSVPVSQDDEENLEENAARMLSSRFDPNCTGFCAKRLKGAADSANDIYFSQSNSERLKGLQGKACSVGSAGRTLRPRRHNGKSFARKRRHFYEVFLRDMDPYCLVKQRIRVFWPLDQNWYFGLIKGYDPVTRLHHVKYDDRDEEWINLQKERFKLLLFPSEVSSKFNFGKPGLEKENKEAEEVDTEESSYLGSLAESEPIISWLARTTRRATSCPSNTTKIHLRVSPLKDTGPSLLLEPPKGSIPMSQLDMKSNNLFLNCKESDQSYDWNINGVSERKRNIDSEEKKLPYVYFRKRFRNKKEDFKTKLTQDVVDCDQGGLASIFPIVNSMSPVWEFKEKLTLVNFQQVIFELSLPLQCTLDFTSQCQSFGLFRSLYIADHGELVCGWPDVHMEVFFVDDIPGLRLILFEGCLKRSISLFCLIIKILNQHVEKCNFSDTEIPCSSIVLCISRLNNSREELLFLNLFSKVESSRWRRFEGKLKKLCTKEASISTPYIRANTLYFSTSEISHSSIKQFEKFWERTNLLHRQDMKKAVDPVLNNFVPCVPEEHDKLFPCSLYLANGSSFYPSLYQKLLIEKDTTSGAQTSVSSQKGADNTNTSTIDASSSSFDGPPKQVPARVGRSGPCFSEAAADHISSGIHTWSSGTYGDRYADTSRVNGHQDVVAGIAGSDDVGNITGHGCVLQSGRSPNEAATSVHALHFGSEYAEDSFPLKSHDDRHMISTTNVEAPLLEEVEKHNLQKGLLIHRHCSNLILEMKEHGIHSPTVPRSMWHRNRHTSLSRTFIHSPKLGSMDLMANGTSSGYKRPRTQVSYSVLSGGYEHASKPLNNHQKVHSHKKVKKHVVNASSEYSRSSQNFSDSLLCEANVLITRGDKCWREVGAKIQLDCDDQKTWRIRVQVSDVTKYVYKAYHVLQPGTTNRYTHAMMWKGGNEWTLEFTHRNQWYIFKQIYEACYNQNIRAASVKNIPIPGVRLLSDSNDGFIEVPFARNSLKYIRYIGTEVDFALDPSHVLYDMDSEDEEWISSVRVSMDSADNKIPEVTEDMFEKVMDRFEKLTYTQQCEELTNEDIEKYMADVGQTDSVEVIYDHWRQKRKKKGLPLIRQFQPPLWEQYQQQLKEWELNQSRMPIQSGGGYKKADIMRKPPMFAFCLRPRGLEVPYKDSKQRSHKKLMFNGHHNVLMREQDSFHNLGRKMDGFSLGEATGSSYESSDSYHGLQSRTTFSPKDTASTESLFAHDSSERFLDARYSRSNSKRIEAFLSPRYPQRTPFTYNKKSRNGINKWSSEFCESSNIKQAPFNGFQRHHADMDEFRLRDATSAAQHALNMAKLKREKAQWLLHKADLSLHRATVALMTAEAIKSYEEDIVGDG